jgi:hypothetical protein
MRVVQMKPGCSAVNEYNWLLVIHMTVHNTPAVDHILCKKKKK